MEMMLANERRAPRRAVLVECQVVRESDFALLGGSAVELSTCGMLLPSDVEAGVGEDVVVSLRMPGTDRWVDTRGHIARIVEGRPEGTAYGIAFSGFDPETARALQEALRSYPPSVPARQPRVDYAATAAMIALT